MGRKPFAIYKNFTGMNDVSDPLALKDSDVRIAQDVDIDIDRNAWRKTNGNTLLTALSGEFPDIWSNGKIMLATENGNLIRIRDDMSTKDILRYDIGDSPMSFVDPAGIGIVYYSNLTAIGYVKNFQSYVMASTTERDRVDTFPMYPIEYFANRLWGFVGDVLWRTDPDQLFYFNRINPEQGFIQRKGHGTLLKAVKDGLYIADGAHWFFANAGRKEEAMDFLCNYDAIPGAVTQDTVDMEIITPEGQFTSGKAHLWMTERGIRYGMNGGISRNLTRSRIKIPKSASGAMIHRNDDDAFNQIITSLRGGL